MASIAIPGNSFADADADTSSRTHARDLLLRRLADLAVLPVGHITLQERGLVDMVMATAVSRLDEAQRRRLAERIAMLPEGPRDLTLALARDGFTVAEPILGLSASLSPSDLIGIIRETGPEHALAIAARRSLPFAVVDALIEHGNARIVCRMLANPGAAISASAVETLARRSASEPEFVPLLLGRPEITARLALLMFWWSPAAIRSEILTRFTVERRMLHVALGDVLEAGLAASGGDEVLRAVLSLMHPPRLAAKSRLAQAGHLASAGRRGDFIAELAQAGRVRPETMLRVVNDEGGEPLAVFGKAIGLTRAEFGDLTVHAAVVRGGAVPLRADIERNVAVFDAISIDRADLVLHAWDWLLSNEAQIPMPDED